MSGTMKGEDDGANEYTRTDVEPLIARPVGEGPEPVAFVKQVCCDVFDGNACAGGAQQSKVRRVRDAIAEQGAATRRPRSQVGAVTGEPRGALGSLTS